MTMFSLISISKFKLFHTQRFSTFCTKKSDVSSFMADSVNNCSWFIDQYLYFFLRQIWVIPFNCVVGNLPVIDIVNPKSQRNTLKVLLILIYLTYLLRQFSYLNLTSIHHLQKNFLNKNGCQYLKNKRLKNR